MSDAAGRRVDGAVPADAGGGVEAARPPELCCYAVDPHPPRLVAASSGRDWMDRTPERFANRCTPLSVANASGWELLCPCDFQAFWTGGAHKRDITITTAGDSAKLARLVTSHFGSGILTFHPGYLFRTSPGWALWCRGPPNAAKRDVVPLDGLVETDWLPFSFTMNWRFTRRNRTVAFRRDEPFCFVSLFPHGVIDAVQPRLLDLADDPDLAARHAAWAADRGRFNADLTRREPAATAQGWQKHYLRGGSPSGPSGSPSHRSKRRLRTPARIRDVDR